jgi:hypothetical protein
VLEKEILQMLRDVTRSGKRSFSATKYGDRRARRLAVQARRRGVGEMFRGRAKRCKTTLAKGSGPKLY